MSIRKKIHLNGTANLFLGIIPVGKGKYDELIVLNSLVVCV
jgi:hypothetical protein